MSPFYFSPIKLLRRFLTVTVSTPNNTFFYFRCNSLPADRLMHQIGNGGGFILRIDVVEFENNNIVFAAINTRMLGQPLMKPLTVFISAAVTKSALVNKARSGVFKSSLTILAIALQSICFNSVFIVFGKRFSYLTPITQFGGSHERFI